MTRPAAAAVALVVLLVAGCGGDPGGDRETYERNGDAICTDYATAIARLGQPTTLDKIGSYLAGALPILERTVARIERLDPPRDLREEYEAFRDAARQTVGRAAALRKAASSADGEEVRRLLAEARDAGERRVELARAAALETCAEL